MAHYTTQKLLELAAGRNARLEYARRAQRAAVENVYTVAHVLGPTLPLAREEQRDFADAFREPMPAHLARTLEAEIMLWERLNEGLERLREHDVTEEVLDAYARRVRTYLAHAGDLLRMEEEMVTSCLVQHYDAQRGAILAAAAALNITRVT